MNEELFKVTLETRLSFLRAKLYRILSISSVTPLLDVAEEILIIDNKVRITIKIIERLTLRPLVRYNKETIVEFNSFEIDKIISDFEIFILTSFIHGHDKTPCANDLLKYVEMNKNFGVY